MLDFKIGKIAEAEEEQDQDKNYGPVGLTTGGSNNFTLTRNLKLALSCRPTPLAYMFCIK